MESNYLVQRRINAQRKYRKKVTLIIALSAILLVLILVGLVKVIMDEKKAEEGNGEHPNRVAENVTPGLSENQTDASGQN